LLLNKQNLDFNSNIQNFETFRQKNNFSKNNDEKQTQLNNCFSTREKINNKRVFSSGCLNPRNVKREVNIISDKIIEDKIMIKD